MTGGWPLVNAIPSAGPGLKVPTFRARRGKPQAPRALRRVVGDPNPEDIDELLERLAKAGRGAFIRGVGDLTKLLERYQPKKPTYKGPHLTDAEYNVLLERQGGSCAICGEKSRDRLVVDHDHETGAVRGLLCSHCNLGLGLCRDNPVRINAAVAYLDKMRGD